MTPVPFDLPVRTGEAGALARILYEHGKRPLTDDLRNRLAVRAGALKLETIRPYFGSLERDPIHPEAFFMAVDGINNQPLLMRFAPSSTPSSGLFPKAILIGRLRVGTQETVINAVPFSAQDSSRIRTFAWQVTPELLPKVQSLKSTISVPVSPGVFEHFRAIAKPMGLNVACVSGDLDTILWEAARSGWRDGYAAESADPQVPGYSRYILPLSSDLTQKLEAIARARVAVKLGRMFDWELLLDDAASPEDTERTLEECRAAGKPAQYVSFVSGRLPSSEDWLSLAKRQNFGFSFSGLDENPSALSDAVKRSGTRFNYRAAAGANPQDLAAALFG
ncbi:MAG TPA: hypothetical protein VGL72_04740 [Bryobacteraceae bacterium]